MDVFSKKAQPGEKANPSRRTKTFAMENSPISHSTNTETLISEHDQHDQEPTLTPSPNSVSDSPEENSELNPSFDQNGILRALEIVERDSMAIAESYASLFTSLRVALSEVTSSSVDHMRCFSDAAGRLQESALDAASRGNRFINSCLRLNEEMKGIESLAMHLKILRQNVDTLDSAVNKLVRLPNHGLSQHVGATKR